MTYLGIFIFHDYIMYYLFNLNLNAKPFALFHKNSLAPPTFVNWIYFFPDENECTSGPCQNGGVCQDLPGSFICSCIPGWTGQYCQIGIICDRYV